MRKTLSGLGAMLVMVCLLSACGDDPKHGSVESSPIYGSWALGAFRDGGIEFRPVMSFAPGRIHVQMTCIVGGTSRTVEGDAPARITNDTVSVLEAKSYGDDRCHLHFHVESIKYRVDGDTLTLEKGGQTHRASRVR